MIPNLKDRRNIGGFDAWRSRSVLIELAITVAAVGLVLTLFSRFILYAQSRDGLPLPDPVLALIPPHNVTVPIFVLVYGAILLTVLSLARHPHALLLTLRAYAILVLIRITAMYLLPLDPPAGMITLVDPIYSLGPGNIVTKDLFFSGHTSLLCLLALTARDPRLKRLFLTCVPIMAALLLVQHCHYAIDILAAPFFAYTCYRIAYLIRPADLPGSGAGNASSLS